MPIEMTQSTRLLSIPLETRTLVYKHIFDGQIVNAIVGRQRDPIRITAILQTCSQIHDEASPLFAASVSLNIRTRDPYSDIHSLCLGIGKDSIISSLRKVNWVITHQPAARTMAAFVDLFPKLESFVLGVEWFYVCGHARDAPEHRDKVVFDSPDVMKHLTFTPKYRSILRCLCSVLQSLRGRGVKQPEVLFKNGMAFYRRTNGRSDDTSTVYKSTATYWPC